MVTSAKPRQRRKSTPSWHAQFLAMLPTIETYANYRFRHRDPENRQEMVQEVICNACCAFKRLVELGKADLAYPTALARYAVAQVNDGRKVGCKLNVRDVLSPYCQRRKDVTVERLDRFDADEVCWMEVLVEDRHAGPAETAASRIDFPAWLRTLSRRDREIAMKLGAGEKTGAVAKLFKMSEGRISQLRRELHAAWLRFHRQKPAPAAALA